SGEGSVLLWVAGAHRNREGRHVIDPARSFAFPLLGRYRGSEVIMSGQNVPLTFSFGDVPVQLLQFRGQLTPSLRMLPGNFLFADASSGQPVSLDYRRETTMVVKHGKLVGAHLRIPAGTSMPARVRAYVLTDVFRLGRRDF